MKKYYFANKTNEHCNEKEVKGLKLNEDQINAFECFAYLTVEEKETLSEFVYNISLVLYKSFKNESTGLFQKVRS